MNRTVSRSAGLAGFKASKLRALEAVCRRDALPLTVQRRVILDALAGRADHPTADQIYADVRTRLPGVSRTTIYRVLDTLARMDLATKTCHPGAAVRFDPRTERHHHLVCVRCEKVVDVHAAALDALPPPDTRRIGFEVRDYSIYFRGVCADCRKGPAAGVRGRTRTRGKARG